ncbi:MAG: 7-cyano-7-deazaguanine synthase QueC [Candidatus Cloacimonetes bacterium]|jgi:7-cyano-7-deazaguanine synthase|nr:7-cyano-7-deazaguanine synthase QueC [Candidatus Cloacimonadota bacterium]MBT6994845.1 7-cyano-7-deazaguanine synthase QueC [Candidatus Cloacimonadota bacterium]MBT7469207.1 7-cyano-7-deazaguanine synthase QueC [Candidatus Cloacimonadota bacterium]
MKGIVLVSGGMDSLVVAAIAQKECDEIYFLHLNYGQKTEVRELRAFQQMRGFFQPKDVLVVDVSYLKQIGGSSLTDRKLEIKDFAGDDGVPNSYVPFRNAHLVTIATSWAEVICANRIYIGAVEEDSSGYPDCRENFYKALEKAIDLGTKDETKIEICTPIIHKRKAEIIQIGDKFGAPLHFSWSCYRDNEIACGTCDSCVLRISAFKEAGLIDPIKYAIEIDWKN